MDMTPEEISRIDNLGLSLNNIIGNLMTLRKKWAIQDADHPGREQFIDLAEMQPNDLLALTIEEFRLQAIAHEIFEVVYPVRDRHDFETFRLYANCMCEVFQVENAQETIATIFDHFNTDGFITEFDFAMCLKQMIGYQLKWAKSKAIREEWELSELRDLLENPEEMRMMVERYFAEADTNHDGGIDRSEFKQVMIERELDDNPFMKIEEEVNHLFTRLDKDCDDKLNFSEFEAFIIESVQQHLSN